MRKRLFKAIYDLILVTIKPLRLLQNSPAARYCGGFGAVLACDSRIILRDVRRGGSD
jgi:hypothetical protein